MFTLGQTSTQADTSKQPKQENVAEKRADEFLGSKKEEMAGSITQREKHGVSLRDKRK